MKKLLLAAALFLAAPARAETPSSYHPPDIAEQKEKIVAIGFLSGDWAGAGWIAGPEGRMEFTQTEAIGPKLGGNILTIHGTGHALGAAADAAPAFEAFAIVSWDDKADEYRFRSYARGHVSDFDAALEGDGVFVWRGPHMEYRITVKGDEWVETGHRILPDGNRTQFFAMTLQRK